MKPFLIILFITLPIWESHSQTVNSERNTPEKRFAFEVSTGLQGSLSFAQVGLNYFPKNPNFWIGAKIRGMSSITWVTFINQDNQESVSFHPTVLAGTITVGGSSLARGGIYRVYGYSELLIGHTSTPYDSYFYDTPNLVGKNITYGIFGVFGIEFFTSDRVSLIIESGGGFKSMILNEEENQYAIASSWIGSGVTLRMGTLIYF